MTCRKAWVTWVPAVVVALTALVIVILCSPETEAMILTGAITVVAWTFVGVYAVRSPWRSNAGGRALMYTSIGIALVGLYLFATWIFGEFPYRAEVRSATLTALLVSLLYRLILALRVQHWERHRDRDAVDNGFPG